MNFILSSQVWRNWQKSGAFPAMLSIHASGGRGKAYARRSRSTHMSMSESDQQLDSDGDKNNNYSLPTQGHAIPTDFGEEDLAFVAELKCLFSPAEEDFPPYFVQT